MNRTIHLNSPCFVWAATTPSWLGRLASYWLMAMTERSGGRSAHRTSQVEPLVSSEHSFISVGAISS